MADQREPLVNLTPWAALILPLGVTRATQIALFDRITDKPRGWFLRRTNPHGYAVDDPRRPYLSVLGECVWCASTWIGGLAVALVAWDLTRAGALLVLTALALSLLAVGADRAYDRWLPDTPPTQATLYGDGYEVSGPPTEVADAFAAVEADR